MDILNEAPAPMAVGCEGKEKRNNAQNLPSCDSAGKAPAAPFPIVVAEWPRNKREVVRVALDHYGNNYTINARVWYLDDAGEMRPGKSGITLALKHLPALADGLAQALRRAHDLGLIDRGAP